MKQKCLKRGILYILRGDCSLLRRILHYLLRGDLNSSANVERIIGNCKRFSLFSKKFKICIIALLFIVIPYLLNNVLRGHNVVIFCL